MFYNLLIFSFLLNLFLCPTHLLAEDYSNSIGMKFKKISAGSFFMGSCARKSVEEDSKCTQQGHDNKRMFFMNGQSEKNENSTPCPSGSNIDQSVLFAHETPQHKVSITKEFMLGRYEVTLGQFKQFIKGAKRHDLLTDDFMKYNHRGDNAAVCCVSWIDTQAFISWLNKKEGGKYYRLPTEAEWEYAVRAGTKTIYSWGDDFGPARKYEFYYNYTHSHQLYRKLTNIGPFIVGQKKPNKWGLYDMHGNVCEWVQDLFDVCYYSNSPEKDPKGPTVSRTKFGKNKKPLHVLRGGGLFLKPEVRRWMRSANRMYDSSDCSDSIMLKNYGFRLLRELTPK